MDWRALKRQSHGEVQQESMRPKQMTAFLLKLAGRENRLQVIEEEGEFGSPG
jgi:hypothetical protein